MPLKTHFLGERKFSLRFTKPSFRGKNLWTQIQNWTLGFQTYTDQAYGWKQEKKELGIRKYRSSSMNEARS